MTNNSKKKPAKYGFLLVLAALSLVQWLIVRVIGMWKPTASELDQQAKQHQHEIENLQIQQEQAKLDLRKVRIKQRELKQEQPEAEHELPFEQQPMADEQPIANGRKAASV